MRSFIGFFIKYPIWANAIKILILGFGAIITIFYLQSSFFPESESETINVQMVYPGASPEEIEEGVIQRIEENLTGIQGIQRFQSTSQENSGAITIEVEDGYNTDDALEDVKNAVERINSFPIGLEPPVVSKRPVLESAYFMSLSGDVDIRTLKSIARDVESELRNLPDKEIISHKDNMWVRIRKNFTNFFRSSSKISQIELQGFPAEEIVLSLSQEKLRAYNLSFDQVSNAISGANLDLTAGSIKTDDEEILIRLKNKKYYAEDLQDIIINSSPSGENIRVSDVGIIENTWAENPKRAFVNEKPAVIIKVSKILGENFLDITSKCKSYVDDFNLRYNNVELKTVRDRSENLRERIDMLIENGIIGSLLVVISLTFFLNWRLAFWVAMSIPFCFAGMFIVAHFTGITINVISLFGCIVVVGILVDDGIVVAEQIYQYYEEGEKPFTAAIDGTIHVLRSVFFAIATTITAFVPIMFLDFTFDIGEMAFVVIMTLIFSFLEVLFILPTHLAHSKALRGKPKEKKFIRKYIDRGFDWVKNKVYAPFIEFFVKNNFLAVAVYISFIIISIGALGGGIAKFAFFPNIESDNFSVNIELEAGSRETLTQATLSKIEDTIWNLNDSIKTSRGDGNDIVEKVVKNVGNSAESRGGSSSSGSNYGSLNVYLMESEIRQINSLVFANMVKKEVGPLYNTTKSEFGATFFGKPISLTIVGRNMEELQNAKSEIKAGLSNFEELRDISDNDPQGTREIIIKLKEKAFLLGLSSREISRQVRQAFFGQEVQRLQRGKDEVKVWVKLDKNDRSSLSSFEDLRIRTNSGEFPLDELVNYTIKRGSIVINHIDGAREITISAELKDPNSETNLINQKVRNEVLEPVLSKYQSVATALTGQAYSQKKVTDGIKIYVSIALIIMFFLIALSFHSFIQSLIVFLLIPLGIFGAVWGHIINTTIISIMSWYGVIALIGIIVNDSIVMVNQFNFNIKRGLDIHSAIIEAAVSRFRPILLTTITTVFGLVPLLIETSVQAQFLIPMAISVAFGLLFASFFILVLLPSLISMQNSIRRFLNWLWHGKWIEGEKIEPAYLEEVEIKNFMEPAEN
ncbi:efflux RND transporter permease subunit [Candidatus Kapabacteria bacterium]|nr:efflux RND transporter permease subunit [Candidatus Kapabacteria bacterium]